VLNVAGAIIEYNNTVYTTKQHFNSDKACKTAAYRELSHSWPLYSIGVKITVEIICTARGYER